MRYLHRSQYDNIDEFDYSAMKYLEELGLIQVAWSEGDSFEGVRLTLKGKEYFNQYPRLGNPVNWTKVAALGAWIAAIAGIVSIFLSCKILTKL